MLPGDTAEQHRGGEQLQELAEGEEPTRLPSGADVWKYPRGTGTTTVDLAP